MFTCAPSYSHLQKSDTCCHLLFNSSHGTQGAIIAENNNIKNSNTKPWWSKPLSLSWPPPAPQEQGVRTTHRRCISSSHLKWTGIEEQRQSVIMSWQTVCFLYLTVTVILLHLSFHLSTWRDEVACACETLQVVCKQWEWEGHRARMRGRSVSVWGGCDQRYYSRQNECVCASGHATRNSG